MQQAHRAAIGNVILIAKLVLPFGDVSANIVDRDDLLELSAARLRQAAADHLQMVNLARCYRLHQL